MEIYRAGDLVMHPSHGGCVIEGVCEREVRGESRRYYVLVPKSEPETTILDPVEGARDIGIAAMITPEEADGILRDAATAETGWIHDTQQRKAIYTGILKSQCLLSLACMVKCLMLQNARVSLNQSDRVMLQNAQKRLLSVIALAKGIELEQAKEMVCSCWEIADRK